MSDRDNRDEIKSLRKEILSKLLREKDLENLFAEYAKLRKEHAEIQQSDPSDKSLWRSRSRVACGD